MHSIPGEKNASIPTTNQGPDAHEGGITEVGDVPLEPTPVGVLEQRSLSSRRIHRCPGIVYPTAHPVIIQKTDPKLSLRVWTRLVPTLAQIRMNDNPRQGTTAGLARPKASEVIGATWAVMSGLDSGWGLKGLPLPNIFLPQGKEGEWCWYLSACIPD